MEEIRDHGVNRPTISDVSLKLLRFFLHSILFIHHSDKRSSCGKYRTLLVTFWLLSSFDFDSFLIPKTFQLTFVKM